MNKKFLQSNCWYFIPLFSRNVKMKNRKKFMTSRAPEHERWMHNSVINHFYSNHVVPTVFCQCCSRIIPSRFSAAVSFLLLGEKWFLINLLTVQKVFPLERNLKSIYARIIIVTIALWQRSNYVGKSFILPNFFHRNMRKQETFITLRLRVLRTSCDG